MNEREPREARPAGREGESNDILKSTGTLVHFIGYKANDTETGENL